MYDILFICSHCGVHLSADEDDVGINLPCPNCALEISVPPGDILFDCPECGKALLASSDSRHQHFHCPYCEIQIAVPSEGKRIAVSKHSPEKPTQDPQESPPQESSSTAPNVPPDPKTRQRDQFMTTWGDYLASAGLTDNDDEPDMTDSKEHRGDT